MELRLLYDDHFLKVMARFVSTVKWTILVGVSEKNLGKIKRKGEENNFNSVSDSTITLININLMRWVDISPVAQNIFVTISPSWSDYFTVLCVISLFSNAWFLYKMTHKCKANGSQKYQRPVSSFEEKRCWMHWAICINIQYDAFPRDFQV